MNSSQGDDSHIISDSSSIIEEVHDSPPQIAAETTAVAIEVPALVLTESKVQQPEQPTGHKAMLSTPGKRKGLLTLIIVNIAFMLAELVTCLITGSLTLMADVLYMLSDAISMIIGYVAIRLADREPDDTFCFGFARTEAIAGLINASLVSGMTFNLVLRAIQDFISPSIEITNPPLVLGISAAGLAMNLITLVCVQIIGRPPKETGPKVVAQVDANPPFISASVFSATARNSLALAACARASVSIARRLDEGESDPDEAIIVTERGKRSLDAARLRSTEMGPLAQSESARASIDPIEPDILVDVDAAERATGVPRSEFRSSPLLLSEDSPAPTPAKKKRSMAVTGMLVQLLGDILGSVAALVSGLLIALGPESWRPGVFYADPICACLISVFIVFAVKPLFSDSISLLMQTSLGRDATEKLRAAIQGVDGVMDLKQLQVWRLTPERAVGSVHVTIDPACQRRWAHICSAIQSVCEANGV